ncbi:MAG: prepilin-type N-terminal cleavage/methylation domain-containing protein [Candidatus Gracilibacteria bacterium]|jgi:prepilin-type N-terminal cleavage/methylation domain-containing protein|nr:prepilin-type N-terminal cleavage/methylation domain-containing protein [Candidatus Gracilibacteria bacterium]
MLSKLKNKKAFTLIELLVVITIIGILATGASTVYVGSQQKARDSIRQTDIMALKGAIEQSYTDLAKYLSPDEIDHNTNGIKVKGYIVDFVSDPKSGEADTQTSFVYTYNAARSPGNHIAGQLYEFSANFENQSNNDKEDEGGDDNTRWEVGVGIDRLTNDGVSTTTDTSAPTGTNEYSTGNTVTAVSIDSL